MNPHISLFFENLEAVRKLDSSIKLGHLIDKNKEGDYMDAFSNLAFSRRSIRKFKNEDIPIEDIEYFVKVATSAPSGCNSQCWRFIAIRDRDIIGRIKNAVIDKIEKILEIRAKEITAQYLLSKRKAACFFANAPVVIAVVMTKIEFYDQILISALKDHGYDDEGIMKLYSNYDYLSIGAAIQNLLLAVNQKGYGACWMSEPAIACEEIKGILGIPLEQRLISLIPIGVPASTPGDKKMKDFREVFSVIG